MKVKENIMFAKLFKKFRLRAGFATLSEFGKALADKGFNFEDSTFSHWQKGTRMPKRRVLLLALIKIFIEKESITSLKEINMLLESIGQRYLTQEELKAITESANMSSKNHSPNQVLEFLKTVGKSKRILRSGWVREKIKDPESVADHSFRLSVISMILADTLGLDKEKLIKMALLHDLGEVVTGDIVWSRGNIVDIEKRAGKEELERKGIEKVFKIMGVSKEYVKTFEEMIERTSQEAKIFWQLDKLEMAIQALEYEKEQGKQLNEFFVNANLQIQSPFLRKVFKEVLRARNPNL